jgi:hypothetical protein
MNFKIPKDINENTIKEELKKLTIPELKNIFRSIKNNQWKKFAKHKMGTPLHIQLSLCKIDYKKGLINGIFHYFNDYVLLNGYDILPAISWEKCVSDNLPYEMLVERCYRKEAKDGWYTLTGEYYLCIRRCINFIIQYKNL